MPDRKRIYWDSCMFYEVLGDEDVAQTKRNAVDELLAENESGGNIIVTSVITHLEVLPNKVAEKGGDDESDYLALFDTKRFAEIELNTNIIMRAREIRNHYYRPADASGAGTKMMDVGDALHLATATVFSIPEFHTRDNRKKKGNVPLLSLYALYGESRICEKYPLNITSPEAEQGNLPFPG